jgi:hypothetical protein
VPPKRADHEILNEILELGRAQAAYRDKTKFIDTYIPTFQQFLPLLQRLVAELNRRNTQQINSTLRHPNDTSLERSVAGNSHLNAFTFPRTLERAMPTDPRSASRSLDLVQMFVSFRRRCITTVADPISSGNRWRGFDARRCGRCSVGGRSRLC